MMEKVRNKLAPRSWPPWLHNYPKKQGEQIAPGSTPARTTTSTQHRGYSQQHDPAKSCWLIQEGKTHNPRDSSVSLTYGCFIFEHY